MIKTILMVSAHPAGTTRLDLDGELNEIRAGLERSRDRSEFRLEYRPAVTWEEMRRALMAVKPEIVHFSGHGAQGKGLIFEGDDGPEFVTKESLKQLFELFPRVECVVLSACYSETEAKAIHKHVPCVVGMNYSVGDRSARKFAVGFYDGVMAGFGYQKAFKLGLSGVLDLLDMDTPVLLFREVSSFLIQASKLEIEEPGQKMAINSLFYIDRPTAEEDACRSIMEPGGLVRIKAPCEFGKSSLMARVVNFAKGEKAKSMAINFWEVDREFLSSLDAFLKWFCSFVGRKLRLESKVAEYWTYGLGSKGACGEYFEEHLLPQIEGALVLELDEVDCLFDQSIAPGGWTIDFFAMLRAWNEKGKTSTQWKKLRLVLVHSKDVGQETIDQSQSPFNVGREIKLPELSELQVQTLASLHGLQGVESIAQQLMALVGGHPHLVRILLYKMAYHHQSLESLLVDGTTESGLYGQHLQRQRIRLEMSQEVVTAFKRVLASETETVIPAKSRAVLESLGLVRPDRNGVRVTCELYRAYFSESL